MKTSVSGKILAAMIMFILLPVTAMAHVGVGEASGFFHGFTHPLGGADHLLAMLAVGLWAAQLGKRALWMVPVAFVIMMLFGGLLGVSGMTLLHAEGFILVSVLVLGLLVAGSVQFPAIVCGSLVGFFSVFHGYAHGTEMPGTIGAFSYCSGFLLATVLLHATGIMSGIVFKKLGSEKISRYAGAVIVFCGIYLTVI